MTQPDAVSATLIHDGLISTIAFAPDGTQIATAFEGEVVLWSADATVIARVPLHGYIERVLYHPTAPLIVSAGHSGSIDVIGLDGTLLAQMTGHTDWVRDADFNGDGSLLITVGADGRAILWDVTGSRIVNDVVFRGVDLTGVDFSADSTTLLITTYPGRQFEWSAVEDES